MLHRGVMQSRQQLAFNFWPDVSEDKARNNLRQLVHQMHRILPEVDRFLQVEASAIGWLNAPDFDLDVAEFEQANAHANAMRIDGIFNKSRSHWKEPFEPIVEICFPAATTIG